MRIRYQEDGNGNRTQPVTGWIRETPGGPVFETSLDLYLSAPYLEPAALGLTLAHDLYSYPLSLDLVGDVTFLDDGRLQIEQRNQAAQSIEVDITFSRGGSVAAPTPPGRGHDPELLEVAVYEVVLGHVVQVGQLRRVELILLRLVPVEGWRSGR